MQPTSRLRATRLVSTTILPCPRCMSRPTIGKESSLTGFHLQRTPPWSHISWSFSTGASATRTPPVSCPIPKTTLWKASGSQHTLSVRHLRNSGCCHIDLGQMATTKNFRPWRRRARSIDLRRAELDTASSQRSSVYILERGGCFAAASSQYRL